MLLSPVCEEKFPQVLMHTHYVSSALGVVLQFPLLQEMVNAATQERLRVRVLCGKESMRKYVLMS